MVTVNPVPTASTRRAAVLNGQTGLQLSEPVLSRHRSVPPLARWEPPATLVDDDAALVDQLLARKPGASLRFIQRHDRFFRAVILKASKSARSVLDDLAQEVYVHLWRDDFRVLRLWRRELPLRAYLGKVVRRLAWERVSRMAPAREQMAGERDLQQAGTQSAPDEELASHQTARLLHAAIERLTPSQRTVIELRYFAELSYRDIAQELHLTPNNVGVRLNRAQANLKRALQHVLEKGDWLPPTRSDCTSVM